MRNYPERQRKILLGWLLVGTAALASVACGDDPVSQPTEGTIRVVANTEGSDFDVNGYVVSVNGFQAGPIETLGTIYVNDLDAGTYEVALGGIASNCSTAAGENPLTVVVTPADTVNAIFEITCEAPPTGGE